MTPKMQQKPLNSGFDWQSTAAEVLHGLDLSGRKVVITGGHSGIGLEATRALAKAGAAVIVGSRNVAAAKAALDGTANVAVEHLDLADLASVEAFADTIAAAHRHIDILINNAGIMAVPETRVGDGWESQFATNHLGHYVLTNRLWPVLKGGARVVSLSSAAHHFSPIRWGDIQFDEGHDKWLAYGQSKTANALFVVELDRLGRLHGVRAFAVHPGNIATPLQRHISQEEMRALGWIDAVGNPTIPRLKTAEQGAATEVWAATSPDLDGLGGVYCEDCDIADLAEADSAEMIGVKPHALNAEEATRLWIYSAELTGVDALSSQNA